MAALQPNFLVRNIYKDSKIALILLIPPPETITTAKRYTVSYFPFLHLQMVDTKYQTVEEMKSKRFTIKESNLYDVISFLDTVLFWFMDPQMPDLFFEGPGGRLVFNTKYDTLNAKTFRSYFDSQQMKAVPALIEVAQDKVEEGIYLFINQQSNMVQLTKRTVTNLFNILRNFNFTSEVTLTLELMKHSINCGTFVSEAEYKTRRENSGFRFKT